MPDALITGGEGALAQAIKIELEKTGYTVHAPGRNVLDVSCAESVKSYFSTLPALDLLVCNAGVIDDQPMARMAENAFDEVVNVNLKGTFATSRAALKKMAKQRCGHLIFISSFSAIKGPAGQANYAAAKAGMLGLAASLAQEYGSRNVRVNSVMPGFLETKMTQNVSASARQKSLESHTLGRFNEVETAARFIAFLDQEMPHTSGQVFCLDSRIHRWT